MYDYALGGSANFEVDRQAAQKALRINPQGRQQAWANRAFLRRVVRHLAQAGVTQFLDLGSGVPTVDHVHQVAQRANPQARVVYVDSDPVAYAYGHSLLARERTSGTAMVQADLRDVPEVLRHSREVLDLAQPVAVLMVAVLHFVMDDAEVADVVAAYRDRTVVGSHLAITHMSGDEAAVRDLERLYRGTSMPFRTRTPDQLRAMFTGYELAEPGVVGVSDWRPEAGSELGRADHDAFVGGLGRRLSRTPTGEHRQERPC